jgi:enamine deaminase RidA (YjgF/YER057c/UK114 family)
MPRTTITSPLVSGTKWPFCAAVRAGDLTFLSGSVGADPASGELPGGRRGHPNPGAQAEGTVAVLDAALAALGSRREELARLVAYHAPWAGLNRVEAAIGTHYGDAQPARSTVGHGLVAPAFLLELEGIAVSGATIERFELPGQITPAGVPAAAGQLAARRVRAD